MIKKLEMEEHIDNSIKSYKLLMKNGTSQKEYIGVLVSINLDDSIINYVLVNTYFAYASEQLSKRRVIEKQLIEKLINKGLIQLGKKTAKLKKGIWGQPILECNEECDMGISISHCNELVAVLLYDRELVLGIDVETDKEMSSLLCNKIFTASEKNIIKKCCHNNLGKLLFWCAKEALSKCLLTGLNISFECLEIENIHQENNYWVGSYSKFKQYGFIGFLYDKTVIVICFPKIYRIERGD